MIRRALHALREFLETDRWRALQARGKPIPFKFRNREYYLNPEEGAIYHIRNSTAKIAKMCDLVVEHPRVVFDVGANCGLFSAFFSEKFPDCRIFAFEPSLELIPIIRLNCHSSKVAVFEYAIGSQNGEETLFVHPGSQQANSLKREAVSVFPTENPIKEVVVPCRSLDSVAEEHGIHTVDIPKVDVQGFEGNVFRGARQVLRNVNCLFVESTWMDIESIVALIPFAIQHGFEYAAVVNPVHMGADILLTKKPIPRDAGAAFTFPLNNDLPTGRWN